MVLVQDMAYDVLASCALDWQTNQYFELSDPLVSGGVELETNAYWQNMQKQAFRLVPLAQDQMNHEHDGGEYLAQLVVGAVAEDWSH